MDGVNCYADEHYLPTFFHVRTYMILTLSISNIYIYRVYISTSFVSYEFSFFECVRCMILTGLQTGQLHTLIGPKENGIRNLMRIRMFLNSSSKILQYDYFTHIYIHIICIYLHIYIYEYISICV